MAGKCKISECPAPISCHDGKEDCKSCPNYSEETDEIKSEKEKIPTELIKSNLNWTGNAFSLDELHFVSARTSPIVIGVIGAVDAGKTSFLGMLYTLLLNGGKFKNYEFAGTKTILSWDELHYKLRLKEGGISFPAPTPVGSNRVYHFALRDNKRSLKDILFTNASGEAFSLWSVNREDENAESARWVYRNSSAFMLFIDCEALVTGKNSAKNSIKLIARQLTNDLKNRPVIAVWSKSDLKSQILPNIKDSLKTELQDLFDNFHEIEISNFLDPGPDELVQRNNLAAVDWLLDQLIRPLNKDLTISKIESDDLFINYRGK